MENNKGAVVVDGITLETEISQFASHNVIEVEVGTNGWHGKSSEGSRTYFSIKDCGGTDMSARISGRSCGDTGKVEIMFGGDAELSTFIRALEFALYTLKKQTLPVRPRGVISTINVTEALEKAKETDLDFFTDPFILQRKRLNYIFGSDYVTQHPELISAAVLSEEIEALRLEMTQLQIAITDKQ